MPKELCAGYSEYTRIKQSHLRQIMSTHMGIVKRIHAKYRDKYPGWAAERYTYLDCYAGPGTVDSEPGSPIIFIELAQSNGLSFDAAFIDNHSETCDTLTKSIDHPNSRVICADAGEVLL